MSDLSQLREWSRNEVTAQIAPEIRQTTAEKSEMRFSTCLMQHNADVVDQQFPEYRQTRENVEPLDASIA